MAPSSTFTCSVCKVTVNGQKGHSPYPLAAEGRCCDSCNLQHVIPARQAILDETKAFWAHILDSAMDPINE